MKSSRDEHSDNECEHPKEEEKGNPAEPPLEGDPDSSRHMSKEQDRRIGAKCKEKRNPAEDGYRSEKKHGAASLPRAFLEIFSDARRKTA